MMKSKSSSFNSRPKKDKFFVSKNKSFKNEKSAPFQQQPSNSGSSSFFITPDEKNKILAEKQNLKKDKLGERFKKERPQKGFVRTSAVTGTNQNPLTDKKSFDKKKWRLKKYSKKYKLQQWEEHRKKQLLRQYYKQVKHETPGFNVQKIYEEYDKDDETESNDNVEIAAEDLENDNNTNECIKEEVDDNSESLNSKQKKNKFMRNAKSKNEMIKEEKQKKREEFLKRKAEKEAAKQEYKKQKFEKYKKLSKKTKKGQPIMKYRMEMLLEQIEKSINK